MVSLFIDDNLEKKTLLNDLEKSNRFISVRIRHAEPGPVLKLCHVSTGKQPPPKLMKTATTLWEIFDHNECVPSL